MRGLLAVLDGSLSPTDSKTLFSKIDADQDGKFHITEIKSALAGDIIQMESIILKLLDDVMVPMPTTNFADFMIFVAQRKKGTNKIRQVFEVCLIRRDEIYNDKFRNTTKTAPTQLIPMKLKNGFRFVANLLLVNKRTK